MHASANRDQRYGARHPVGLCLTLNQPKGTGQQFRFIYDVVGGGVAAGGGGRAGPVGDATFESRQSVGARVERLLPRVALGVALSRCLVQSNFRVIAT